MWVIGNGFCAMVCLDMKYQAFRRHKWFGSLQGAKLCLASAIFSRCNGDPGLRVPAGRYTPTVPDIQIPDAYNNNQAVLPSAEL